MFDILQSYAHYPFVHEVEMLLPWLKAQTTRWLQKKIYTTMYTFIFKVNTS